MAWHSDKHFLWDTRIFSSRGELTWSKIQQELFIIIIQVLTDVSYTRAVDWWGLGVLIYEMLVGEVSINHFMLVLVYM